MTLTEFHGFQDSVRWRLVPAGIETDPGGVERTKGAPATVTRVWQAYGNEIDRTAREYRVPCALIVATICTESGGRADAVRQEPGYKSDETTPKKVSVGLMQTLISTASETLGVKVDRAWLAKPENSIRAGTAYIAKQARLTKLDPPLVAAAYNAGGLYHQTGTANRWKLRQYPIGTGAHCDRFVRFFNDAVAVLAQHGTRPGVGIDAIAEGALPKPPAPAPSTAAAIEIAFGTNADKAAVTPHALAVLEDVLRAARCRRALISSTSRSPREQARVMFNNLEQHGVTAQKELYGPYGDKVIDVYAAEKAKGKRSDEIRLKMEEKIKEVGPTNVSRHASDPKVLCVFDVAPSSIVNTVAFEHAVRNDRRVSYFLKPPKDPGYHLEVPPPR